MTQIHLDIIVTGRVQGVGFRAGAAHKAKLLKLTGWAKNKSTNKVEISVEGSEKNILEFVNWCKEGTMLSIVEKVVTKDGNLKKYKKFSISK